MCVMHTSIAPPKLVLCA